MQRVNGLWLVVPEDSGSGLWIIAATIESASKKAKKFLKLNGRSTKINKIENNGTIDVF